ncbi:MAG TPA: tetratricopeptide repeat protein, partial [Planctomycetaceae bacterium]|nr:tetratricopeptide repeat protein [Planctomycetaceae bacterium]
SNDLLRGLFVSEIKMGELACRKGEDTTAAEHFAKARDIATRLSAVAPADKEGVRDLSVALEKLGSLSIANGNLHEARVAMEESFAIRERLAKEDSDNPARQRDLSVSLSLLGDLSQAQEDPDERALACYQRCLAIREQLGSEDPDNTEGLWDISGCLGRLGMVELKLGRIDEALSYFERNRDILAKLVKSDSDNIQWRQDFAICFAKLADIACRREHLESMDANFEACYTELESIKERIGKLDEDLGRVHQNFRSFLISRIQQLQTRGNQLYSANRDSEAVPVFRHALRLGLLLHGENHSQTVTAWNSLGGALAATGEVMDAERCYRTTVFILGTLLRQSRREPDNLRQALQNYDRFLRDIGLNADVVASRIESVLRGENVSDLKARDME